MSYDKETNKAYLKNRYKNQIKEFHNYLGNKCTKCGSTKKLEIDHIDPSIKLFGIAKLWPIKKLPEVYKELDKCQLLCKKCHLEKTLSDPFLISEKKYAKHGTTTRYSHHKCRCQKCKTAYSIWKREYRFRIKETLGKREQYNTPTECGTIRSYYRGCRCNLCKKANAEKQRARGAKNT